MEHRTDLSADSVLEFWIPQQSKWFQKSKIFDAEVKTRFLPYHEAAQKEQLQDWLTIPEFCVALIIVLDQFPRNMFRGTPMMYTTDALALKSSKYALENQYTSQLSSTYNKLIYLPFMHSEDYEEQQNSVKLFTTLGDKVALQYAIEHAKIIERFGRFPHRNLTLGRTSTEAELAFLSRNRSF